jgi:hypothetical protein
MNLYEKPSGVETRWVSFENPTAARGAGGRENRGAKGRPYEPIAPGETKTLMDVTGSGTLTRIWMTISDRSPQMLRGLRLDMYWDGAETPAVSVPLGDFFGIGLGQMLPFECALFSSPQGRSFNAFVPMPFRTGARVTLTNETDTQQPHLFYDIDFLLGVAHTPETLYFHAHWRRESPNTLGEDFLILPTVPGSGRFLGCNVGVLCDPRYEGAWWGEGEVKVWFGDEEYPTLCGTGTEDYIGTGWSQGRYTHRTQGCTVSDDANDRWAFYRYHVDDPVFFDGGCRVAIQTMGGTQKNRVAALQAKGVPLIPNSVVDSASPNNRMLLLMEREQPVDLSDPSLPHGPGTYGNFWRQDDWSATAYFYLDRPDGVLPPLAPVVERIAGL